MSYTGFVPEDDTVKTTIYIDISKKRPVVVLKPTEEDKKKSNIKEEFLIWKYWDYGLQCKINKEARVTNVATQQVEVDIEKLHEAKLRYLLKDWSFKDDTGNKVALKRSGNKLTDEAFKKVTRMEPMMLLAFFERLDRILYLGEDEEKKF